MEQATFESRASATAHENRRAARIRRVRPVAFSVNGGAGTLAQRTVTANISRGGMLLVTRQDRFPPAGSSLTLMPYQCDNAIRLPAATSLPGRIVYIRFSPRAELRFAGLKFETDLDDHAARLIGLHGAPDEVSDTLKLLERIEALPDTAAERSVGPQAVPTTQTLEREFAQLGEDMERTTSRFIDATVAFLITWGETLLRETIARRHPLARAKGVQGLARLKGEWRELIGGLPAIAEAQLDRDPLWPHRSVSGLRSRMDTGEAWFYDVERDQPPDRILRELRKLAGFIGRLVVRHGFEDVSADGDWVLITTERALVSYRGRLTVSDAMRDALREGARLQAELAGLIARSEDVRESEARAEALRLWDEAN
jgi:hypothetical protein